MASPVPRLLIRARDLTVGDKKLGVGAFGIVYQGKWNGLDVAVKITKMEKLREASPLTGEELTDSELMAGAMEDVLSEAQEMLYLRHPNIVQFLGVCTDAKHGLMIVSELCKGGSLDKYLAKNRPLPPDVRDRFVREICEGVQYLHDHDIVHRALKPGNILLGERLVIKISDFGMTRNVQVTLSSSAGSKRHGMAECGGPPFEGQAPLIIITAVVVRKQTPRIPDSLPEHIKSAIKSCFAFKPEDRPTAKELLAKLGIPASPSKGADPVLVPPSPVSPVDVPSAGAPPSVHTSMASTVPGPPSTVHPAQVGLVVAEEQTAPPAQQPSVKTPPSTPQPQIKHADLFRAAVFGDEQSVHLLIEREGKDILDKRDELIFKLTPFLWAANKGHVGVMSVMYESKPDVLQQTEQFGNTVMHLAVNRGHVAMVNKLLEWDPKLIDARTPSGETPFMEAARDGHVDVLEALYDKRKDLVTQKNILGETALHEAAGHDEIEVMKFLYEMNGSILQQTGRNGNTALHSACWGGHLVAVNKLLAWDPKLIDARDKKGRTPFMQAAIGGNVAVLKVLLKWGGGALLDIKNNYGETPWDNAEDEPETRKIMEKYKRACGPCCVIM
ncbi:unnamed protein product [Vitrella brassicaformis CCMP3155]|uniref:Protein kinase domain-containing protein n=1 Tax=Vitrella brassicaformis (strain CCMP3155) TaxID=1169540 RepID=A0A0G4F561_VITBC|nr:unnamed protein product [Vitrella brassicaformis CCMP3155]|eukprot:CEM06973.1 unnamed protein product [Vitrella brassicaformis CCMP3155]